MNKNNDQSIITVTNLTKNFGRIIAVDHLNFTIKKGEVFGLLGPNGAGKTTTLRLLAGLLNPTQGLAYINNFNVQKQALRVREIVGILTENPNLYDRLTALENMNFFAEAYGLSNPHEKQTRIHQLLNFFELWDRRNDKVIKYSKGMKQKLAIARTLVHQPPILFLDEPTAGLDPESATNIRKMIADLSKNGDHTVLLSTHRLEDAEKLCQRVMIISNGKKVALGTPNQLQDRIVGLPSLQIMLKRINKKLINNLMALPWIKHLQVDADTSSIVLSIQGNIHLITPKIVRKIVIMGGLILSVNILKPSLEETYLKLIKEG